MNNTAELNRVLVDVRKAYRLLHDFQRLAMDAAKYFGDQLGLIYSGGYPNFSSPAPRSGRGHLGLWGWDWLNMYLYDFNFKWQHERGAISVSIILVSDSGYFISTHAAPTKDRVETFCPPDRASTKIIVLLYRDWPDRFTSSLFGDRESMGRLIEKGLLPSEHVAGGVRAKIYDFAQISDESSADRVIDDLVVFADTEGFPIKRVSTRP